MTPCGRSCSQSTRQLIMAADREAAEAELAKQLKAQKQSDMRTKSNDPHHWTAYIRRHSEGRYPWHRSSAPSTSWPVRSLDL